MRPVLEDVRIVSLEQYGAGPFATMHLAELGAEVIKVEQWPDGDIGRHVPPYRTDADSLFFQSLNRSKKSICLDLRQPEGRTVFEDLVRSSDAVFSNLRGDVPSRLGITYRDLAPINPAIVCCSLSGYGMTGPMAAHPGFDYMVQGLVGWMSITGEPEGPPSKTGLSAVDFAAGYASALALMTGLHQARRDGVGCDCDVSLLETALSMLNYLVTWAGTEGYEPQRVERSGHPTLVPFQNFRTADGWIVAGGSKEKFWLRMAEALGRGDLTADPRFATFDDRRAHKAALIHELDTAFASESTQHWLTLLETAGVPCAPINSVGEALHDPQVVARDAVFTLPHAAWGQVTHVASPLRVGDQDHVRQPAPALGADTRSVLTNLLGYDDGRIAQLAKDGVIGGPGVS
ncbi:MAG: CoA transferase [Candidatus Nanopelagicales bacterium]|nr:CoA transferase [Candidatus Nanopelagicales bacterium]